MDRSRKPAPTHEPGAAPVARRRLLLAAGAAMALPAILPRAASAALSPTPLPLRFQVFREGQRIGTHAIGFARDGETLRVSVRIEIAVELLFVTAYRYSHRNEETWRGGVLQAIATRTDDDGRVFSLEGRRMPEGLVLRDGEGRSVLPAATIPSSFWHPDLVAQDRLLNTQDGRLMAVRFAPGPQEAIPGDGGSIQARRYVCSGDLELELWRDRAARLAGMRFRAAADGSVIDYRREAAG